MAHKSTITGFLVAALVVALSTVACSTVSGARPEAAAAPQIVTPDYAYVFGKERVAVVDPQTAKVVKEITAGLAGAGAWNDAVVSADEKYIFINEKAKAQVFVFDTGKQELAKVIDIGGSPVHIYLPNHGTEVWSHSDAEGTFYIIDTRTLEVTGRVNASTGNTGHGKLLYSTAMGTKYYATNVTEPAVFVVDGTGRAVTKRIELCQGDDGVGGTHGKGFSSLNNMAYFQCTGSVQKTAVVDTTTDTLVKYLDTNGQMFMTAGEKYAVVANGGANRLDVIDGSTTPETLISIDIPNKPDKIYYASVDGKTLAFTADLKAPDVDVVDLQSMSLLKSVPGTPLQSPLAEDKTLGRNADIGGGYFFAVLKDEGQLSIIDTRSLNVIGSVKVDGAVNVAFVGKAN